MEQRRVLRERWVILLVLGTFLLGLPGLFSIPAERVLFNPLVYKQALVEHRVYDDYPLILGDLLASSGSRLLGGSGDALLNVLEKSRYDQVIRQIFPAAWVRDQAERLIDQSLAYFNLESRQMALVVDFRPVKIHLAGDNAPRIASTIVQSLPACTADSLLQYGLALLNGQAEGLPLCRPPEAFVELTNRLVGGLLQTAAGALPDQMDLAPALRAPIAITGDHGKGVWAGWWGIYRLFRQVGPFLPWLALALAAAAGVLAVKTRQGPLFWLGWALALPGLSAAVAALLIGVWSSQIVPLIAGNLFGSSIILEARMADVLTTVVSRFVLAVVQWGLGAAAAGAGLILVWGVLNLPRR